jgi:site-specific DNA-adenine methylase
MNFDNINSKLNTVLLGCNGNKLKEYKRYLKDIILNNITKDDIFVEPFCGTAIISYNLFNSNNIKTHINDIDHYRIQFYNNCKDINYIREVNDTITSIKNKDDYYKLVKKNDIYKKDVDFNTHIYSKLISSYRPGLFDDTRKKKLINENWNEFLNNTIITNKNFIEIMELYKDNEKAFIYLDPPYMNSANKCYITFRSDYNDDNKKIDNTKIYIDIYNYLKICKCKILMSINNSAIIEFIFKDYIKNNYNVNYNYNHKDKNGITKSNNDEILIISNF